MKELNAIFLLEDKSGKVKLYEREKELLSFHREVLDNEEISFYYHLKDSAVSIEEKLIPKITKGDDGERIDEFIFKIIYGEKVLFSYEIECNDLTYSSFNKNEVAVFYFMESIIDKFEKEILEEHKKIVLYKSE